MTSWMDDAACNGIGTDLFFGYEGDNGQASARTSREAVAICRTCPVRAECLEFALDNDERYGVWGGKTEWEREQILRERRGLPRRTPGPPPGPCGTAAGYRRHLRHGEKSCQDCHDAYRVAQREWSARRRRSA